jgi:hypothetical protein
MALFVIPAKAGIQIQSDPFDAADHKSALLRVRAIGRRDHKGLSILWRELARFCRKKQFPGVAKMHLSPCYIRNKKIF